MLDDYAIAGPADLSRAAFARLLRQAQSPAAPEAGPMYDALVSAGVRPAVALAFFGHESRFGTTGICAEYQTHNIGNVRSPERAGPGVTVVDTPRGAFASYQTWTLGASDWALRLRGPKYEGRGLLTVRQVLPVYAPPSDGNDPDAYARAVLASIERWTQEGPAMVQLTTRVSLLPAGVPNNPDRPLWGGKPRWITIHETDNPNVGANAEMHRKFVLGGGGPDTASFHAVCDDHESIQLLPWTAAAYHVGDGDGGEGNNTSIGIELCVNQDGDFAKTVDRGARLTAALMQQFGLGIDAVRQHGSWWSAQHPDVHRGCPANLKGGKLGQSWDGFVALVRQKFGAGPAPAVDRSAKLKGAYAALPHWIVGDIEFEATADLGELRLARDAQCLVCEKSVLWTDGTTIDAFHRGQYEDFKARGKVTESRSRDVPGPLRAGVAPRAARRLAQAAARDGERAARERQGLAPAAPQRVEARGKAGGSEPQRDGAGDKAGRSEPQRRRAKPAAPTAQAEGRAPAGAAGARS
jgi:hypothetical protein